jgi:hypothetical protein
MSEIEHRMQRKQAAVEVEFIEENNNERAKAKAKDPAVQEDDGCDNSRVF